MPYLFMLTFKCFGILVSKIIVDRLTELDGWIRAKKGKSTLIQVLSDSIYSLFIIYSKNWPWTFQKTEKYKPAYFRWAFSFLNYIEFIVRISKCNIISTLKVFVLKDLDISLDKLDSLLCAKRKRSLDSSLQLFYVFAVLLSVIKT